MKQKPLSFAISGATRGGGEPSFAPLLTKISPPLAPISLDSSMIMSVDHLLSDLVHEEKKCQIFSLVLRASFLIE